MRRVIGAVVAAISVASVSTVPSAVAADRGADTTAVYNGKEIDMAVSWEGAQACWVSAAGALCFDTEQEMDDAMQSASVLRGTGTTDSSCSSDLRLYDGASYGLPVLALSLQGSWIPLSGNGFSAKTSSYVVGACNSAFKDASSLYPGSTSAGSSSSAMSSGWNNRITQVFIN